MTAAINIIAYSAAVPCSLARLSDSRVLCRRACFNSHSSGFPKGATQNQLSCLSLSKRELAVSTALSLLGFSWSAFPAFGILEPDEDEELLEKVKADRKKRLQNQQKASILNSEAAFIQEAVYRMSEVGQAIEKSDFGHATQVLGTSLDTTWIANVKEAFSKVSSDTQQKTKADLFTTSLASLISAVSKQNLDLSKSAFVSSADALEDWATLTGLSKQLKGL
eukprot:TRINITY_DN2996_c0_g1_i1.p1 TRINITY_DN2996_c0_g1~~TRINITY_DN2996_c0_g1_i1.p1  ORF type:complete len:222 (+),score=48.53 TRINITY_DN2996_c0_g1_i1:247-912(+)